MDWLLTTGRIVFALAITAIGIETVICANATSDALGPAFQVIPIIPFLPAVSWLAIALGVVWAACGVGLLFERTKRPAALIFGTLFFVCLLTLEIPANVPHPWSITYRTVVFEVLALAALAWMIPQGPQTTFVARISRYLFAFSLVVFGCDHFLALAFIATLLPAWIPWHTFWVAFFGVALIAGGLSIASGILQRTAAACVGLVFLIWVVTLHLPRVLGLYATAGAPQSPAEWSSLFIAVAMWGGSWSLAAHFGQRPRTLGAHRPPS